MTKKILIVGDMHAGSEVAVMPESMSTMSTPTERARMVFASPLQMKILDKWHEMIDTEGVVDAVIANGDLVDGYHRKGNGMGCWTTDMDVQKTCAQKLLKEIKVRKNKIYGTQGSLYHTNDNISVDKLVVEELGGTFNEELAIKDGNLRMHFSHQVGVSGSTWQYRTTPIAKEMVMNELNQMDFGRFDIIARNHAHYYCAVQFGNSLGMICPCWKGRDEYVQRKGLTYNPSIGYVLIETNGDSFTWTHNLMHLKGDCAIHTYDISEMEEL